MEDLYIILALGLVAMIAGFIDAIAGGGGLITLPALLLAGIPPVSAIATNKLQAAAATFSATVSFARKGLIDWKKSLPIAAASFAGGVVGALSVSLVSKDILLAVVPVLLIFVALYFVFSPKLDGSKEGKARMSFFSIRADGCTAFGFLRRCVRTGCRLVFSDCLYCFARLQAVERDVLHQIGKRCLQSWFAIGIPAARFDYFPDCGNDGGRCVCRCEFRCEICRPLRFEAD